MLKVGSLASQNSFCDTEISKIPTKFTDLISFYNQNIDGKVESLLKRDRNVHKMDQGGNAHSKWINGNIQLISFRVYLVRKHSHCLVPIDGRLTVCRLQYG